uniref:Uncharacterized protein n=1 Tax=Leersia perrieri TaxID=77586 RepID=A0A0D9XK20_9ORYZ
MVRGAGEFFFFFYRVAHQNRFLVACSERKAETVADSPALIGRGSERGEGGGGKASLRGIWQGRGGGQREGHSQGGSGGAIAARSIAARRRRAGEDREGAPTGARTLGVEKHSTNDPLVK